MMVANRSRTAKLVSWIGLGFGVMLAALFVFIFIGETVQSRQRHPGEPVHFEPNAIIQLVFWALFVVGMFAAPLRRRFGLRLAAAGLTGASILLLIWPAVPITAGSVLALLIFWLPILLIWGTEPPKGEALH